MSVFGGLYVLILIIPNWALFFLLFIMKLITISTFQLTQMPKFELLRTQILRNHFPLLQLMISSGNYAKS